MSFLKQQKETVKLIYYFFKPYKMEGFFVLGAMLFSGIVEALNLAALYPIINFGLNADEPSGKVDVAHQFIVRFGGDNPFLFSCVLLLVISIVSFGIKIFYNFAMYKLVKRVDSDIQKSIFNKYVNSSYGFFVNGEQGRLIYASTTATNSVSHLVFYIMRFLNDLTLCIFFSSLLLMLAWQGMVALVVVGLIYVALVRKIIRDIVTKAAEIWTDQTATKNVILNEFITGIKTIKIFRGVKFWQNKFNRTVDNCVEANFKTLMGQFYPDGFIKFIFFGLIAGFGIVFSMKGSQQILPLLPMMATFGAVASRLFPYINMIGADFVAIARFIPDARIVFDTLNQNIQPTEDGKKQLVHFNNKIAFENVWFTYPGIEEALLQGVSFEIQKGKITAIVGSSGSGKSTIAHLLLKLFFVNRGAITVDGINIKELTNDSYLKKIGYVSQETFIFNGTIKDNIQFGLDNCTDQEIERAAQLAFAHDFIVATPKGYLTIVGDAGVKLSGGQRQRIAIARAMLRKPEILILDEATSSLDTVSERTVQDAINNVTKHTTVLVIAHRLSTVQNADQIIVLNQGSIVEEGTHQRLLENKNAYYQLYTTG